ncbi:MAG TPA: TIGR03000 domain-containing protein [Gemmataceae bacterium]|nr:TIGR03000 domain-containing protein [Gemmataceae bacterium]
MRQLRFALELSKRHILAVVTITMLASPVWAYINGEHYDSLDADKQRLKMLGWTSAFEHYLSTSALPDKAALRRTANGLVGQALHHLPEEDAAKVSTETKQEIARIAREAFEQASMEVRQIIKTGQVGSLRYQVGALSWHRYSVTYDRDNQPRKKGQWGGLVPFVALRSTDRVRWAEAKIAVALYTLPADTKIFFDGEPTTQTGPSRDFVTPSLEVGKNYQYEILARWQEKGKEVTQSHRVSMTGGDSVNVAFGPVTTNPVHCKWVRYTGGRKTAEACSFAYSLDRKTVVKVLSKGTGLDDKLIRLYEAATDKPLGPKITLHGHRVTALAVSPDGKTIATGFHSEYNRHYALVRVWDATSGKEIGGYYDGHFPHLDEVFDLTFFQNGKFVLIIALPKKE